MLTTKQNVYEITCGNLVTTCFGGVLYASQHPNSVSEEELAIYRKNNEVILNRTPPSEIKKLFQAGYLQILHSIDDVMYLYSKDGV